MRNLDRDAELAHRLIREFLDEDRPGFVRAAAQMLRADAQSRESQHLIAVLLACELLLPTLSEQAIGKEQAVAIVRAALRIDPNADLALARSLTEIAFDPQHERDHDQHARLIEVLAA